ncbi:MAG: hypothetical protein IPI68_06720 [Chitinophagaceae bacterium]|nr:hypothetical protein [Chitinophagaceae bacterium]
MSHLSFILIVEGNALLQGGKSRITLPVLIPKNTVEWYYTFSANREEEEVSRTKNSINLMGQLTKLIDKTGVLNIGVEMLTKSQVVIFAIFIYWI